MKEIPLTRGYVALVDDADFDELSQYSWQALVGEHGVYAMRKGPRDEHGHRACVTMHQHIMGKAPEGAVIDHRDGVGTNNQRSNLRFATHGQSSANRKLKRRLPLPRGVDPVPSGRFRARIMHNNKNVCLGTFDSVDLAKKAYERAAERMFGEYALHVSRRESCN